jgi:putative transposase
VEYRRKLPHIQPDGAALFITFRLYGTQPATSVHDGRTFDEADRQLERSGTGPSWLKNAQVAECVTATIRMGDQVKGLYDLIAFVVRPNHVHLLIDPKAPAPKITQFLKGVSARNANALLRPNRSSILAGRVV